MIAAAVESAIISLGAAERVHMYRWGDGCAHFHVHFIGRPARRPQFSRRNLPFLESRLPDPSDDERARVAAAITGRLAAAHLPD